MTEIVSPFAMTYEGNDADRGVLNAQSLGISILGASRLSNAVAHYCAFGFVPRGNYKRQFHCYAKPPRDGCFEYWLYVAAIGQEYNLHGPIYKAALTFLFGGVTKALKSIWTKKDSTVQVVETLAEVMKEESRNNRDVQMQLANAIIKGNDNISALHSKLIDTLPALADATRGNGKSLVLPIGNTCTAIRQFTKTPFEFIIDEPEAEVIRGDPEMEVDDMRNFTCRKITEVNIETGHCILDVEGFDRQ